MIQPPPDRIGAFYRGLWHASWGLAARYHRYECEGFEHLTQRLPALIVGYHGRPYTMDLFMLTTKMQRELGWMPSFFTLQAARNIPALRDLVQAVGGFFEAPDDQLVRELVGTRKLFAVTPGGAREGFRPAWRDRYRVDFGDRRGYLRFALRYGMAIVPVAATGVDDLYFGINDGYRLSKRVFGHGHIPLWLGVGMGGVWPFALPWPVKIRQRIGAPIVLDDLKVEYSSESELLDAANARVTGAIQSLLDGLHADARADG